MNRGFFLHYFWMYNILLQFFRALDEVERIYEEGERARREELRHTHPIFSRIEPWLAEQLGATHGTLVEQHKWRPHQHALALCRQNNLTQHAYFLQRDLSFMREVWKLYMYHENLWCCNNVIYSRYLQYLYHYLPVSQYHSPSPIPAGAHALWIYHHLSLTQCTLLFPSIARTRTTEGAREREGGDAFFPVARPSVVPQQLRSEAHLPGRESGHTNRPGCITHLHHHTTHRPHSSRLPARETGGNVLVIPCDGFNKW